MKIHPNRIQIITGLKFMFKGGKRVYQVRTKFHDNWFCISGVGARYQRWISEKLLYKHLKTKRIIIYEDIT